MNKQKMIKGALTSAALACYSLPSVADYAVTTYQSSTGSRHFNIYLDPSLSNSDSPKIQTSASENGVYIVVYGTAYNSDPYGSISTSPTTVCSIPSSSSAYELAYQAVSSISSTPSAPNSSVRKRISYNVPTGSTICNAFSVTDSRS